MLLTMCRKSFLKHRIIIVFLIGLVFQSCQKQPDSSRYIAFSLKQAFNAIGDNSKSPLIKELAGINRVFGYLYDDGTDDIILIGGKYSSLPSANIEELIVALRSRIIYDEWPLVSIDPVEETTVSNLQEVRFAGHIHNTSLGDKLFRADVLLKEYSLGIIENQSIQSFAQCISNYMISEEKQDIKDITWVFDSTYRSFESDYKDQAILHSTENDFGARFWFYVNQPVTYNFENIFMIKQSDLAVQYEKYSNNLNTEFTAGCYTNQWNDQFYKLSLENNVVASIKQIYDYVSLAEGIARMNEIPSWISSLCESYTPAEIRTPEHFKYLSVVGNKQLNDGNRSFIVLSGGIELKTQIQYIQEIEGGNYQVLKQLAISSRPDFNSLYWNVTLPDCHMPNTSDLPEHEKIESEQRSSNTGTYMSAREYYINPSSSIIESKKLVDEGSFSDFRSLTGPDFPAPLSLKGVSMYMTVDEKSFKKGGEELIDLKKEILNRNNK